MPETQHKERQRKLCAVRMSSAEIASDLAEIERLPIMIIAKFLSFFDEHGRQISEVPIHILELLAERFDAFMYGRCNSLDKAFGPELPRQRTAVRMADRNFEILFDFFIAKRAAKFRSAKERGGSTPFEIAVKEVAERHKLGEDNVRYIYKSAGAKSLARKSRKAR